MKRLYNRLITLGKRLQKPSRYYTITLYLSTSLWNKKCILVLFSCSRDGAQGFSALVNWLQWMHQPQTDHSEPPESPVLTIVQKVADRKGIDPTEVSPPLQQRLDTDALNRLFAPTHSDERSSGQLMFTYCGHEVTVHANGDITVEDDSRSRTHGTDPIQST